MLIRLQGSSNSLWSKWQVSPYHLECLGPPPTMRLGHAMRREL
jgi:hypothetical protein